ncbi:MAG: hypothetical protein AB7H71_05695 [Alphaproteobacteria bacterium]
MALSAPATRLRTDQLSRPDRLLLWAIRAWVIGLKRRLDVAPPLAVAFHRAGVPEGGELIDALMSVVACGAVRTLAVECVCEAGVSEDESRLLAAAALHQQGRSFEARFLLREILTPAASSDAGQLLERLGAVLRTGDLALSTWTIGIERFVFGPAPDTDAKPMRPTLH